MKTVQGQVLASLRATQALLDEQADRLPGLADSSIRRRLDAVIVALPARIAVQSATSLQSRGATRRLRALRRTLLRDHLRPLTQIAREAEPSVPALAPFRMPRGRPSVGRLAAMAQGMAQAAAPHAPLFVAAGLRPGFLDRLAAATEAMVDAIGERTVFRTQRCEATAGIEVALSQGRRLVRVLDAIVVSAWDDEPGLLAAWHSATRVRRVPVRRASAAAVAAVAVEQTSDQDALIPAAAAPRAVVFPSDVSRDLLQRFGVALRTIRRQPPAHCA